MTGHKRGLLAAMIIGIAVLTATLLPMIAWSDRDAVREIRLVARDMRFYLEGGDEPNPTLTLRAGEQVRIVLRHEDPGFRHDFAVKDWTLGTRLLSERGEEAAVTFRVPDAPGDHAYHCTPHPRMMAGTLRVE